MPFWNKSNKTKEIDNAFLKGVHLGIKKGKLKILDEIINQLGSLDNNKTYTVDEINKIINNIRGDLE